MRSSAFALWVVLLAAGRAGAQQPVVAPAPETPQFMSRTDFHLNAAKLTIDDQRFVWDTHFGGGLDVIDYVAGRFNVLIDYEAVLGHEFRAFDPNQGNYTLEGSLSKRFGATEVAAVFNHLSRHLGDRPKRIPIDWNALGLRALRRDHVGTLSLDVVASLARMTKHDNLDYLWKGDVDMLARRPMSPRAGLFAHGRAEVYGVDSAMLNRSTQAGGVFELGVHLNGRAGAVELFAGFERRVDADPLDLQPQSWGLAGFRLLSR
ncbi:MAG: hypothetical protein HY047_14315 [Acidobacteria bacterium]|nr:hypothetical protein [Acidobacteriota bacterium]